MAPPESQGHVNSASIAPKGVSTGRGGAGNIRSRSTSRNASGGHEHTQTPQFLSEHACGADEYERQVLQKYVEARNDVLVTGRGGRGNISRSRSRSRSRDPAWHSSGRGGAGNILQGAVNPEKVDIQDDEERLQHTHTDGIHSTGRGGVGNLADGHDINIEVVYHNEAPFESSGRGGAGNIRDRSRSRESRSRNPSKEKSTVLHLWNKVTHPPTHIHTEDPNAIREAPGKERGE